VEVERSTLLVAVGSTLGGLAVVMTTLAVVVHPILFLVAVPFAAAGYLLWAQGTGRLEARARRRARRAGPAGDAAGAGPGGRSRFAEQARRRAERGRAAGGFAGGAGPGTDRAPTVEDGPTPAEARQILGVDADSDAAEVKRAYREQVKECHPDTDGGDEERFKRVTAAYERLSE
jgi:hypothetical protein